MLRKTVLSLATFGAVGAALLTGIGVAQAAPAPAGASAILDSGTNFSEPDGSQGISGMPGECIAVQLNKTGSIQFVTGTMTLWTGANCNTGHSLVVDHDVADLNALGFGKTVSILIGGDSAATQGTPIPAAPSPTAAS
jgi:hypothetical protein